MDLEKAFGSYPLTGIFSMVRDDCKLLRNLLSEEWDAPAEGVSMALLLASIKIECLGEVGVIFKNSIYIYSNLALKGHFIFSFQARSVLGFSSI